jgi:hypothetical protein
VTTVPTETATPHPDEQLFVSNGAEVLSRSATAYESQEVTSFTGASNYSFKIGTFALNQSSDFASQAPDRLYVRTTYEGGDAQGVVDLTQGGVMEMLARDGSFFLNFGDDTWVIASEADLGAEEGEFGSMLDWGAPFDYKGFLDDRPEDVRYIGTEDVNGHTTARYKFEGTLQGLFASFAEAFGDVGDMGLTEAFMETGVDGPITIDIWVGKDDYLPYKLAMTTSMNTAYGRVDLTGQTTFDNYNAPAPIPEAPADPITFEELFADWFGVEEASE